MYFHAEKYTNGPCVGPRVALHYSHTAFRLVKGPLGVKGGDFLSSRVCVCLSVCVSVRDSRLDDNGFRRRFLYLRSLESGERPRQLYFSKWPPYWQLFSKWPTAEKQIIGF